MIEAIALVFALGFFALLSIMVMAIMQVCDELRKIARALQTEEE